MSTYRFSIFNPRGVRVATGCLEAPSEKEALAAVLGRKHPGLKLDESYRIEVGGLVGSFYGDEFAQGAEAVLDSADEVEPEAAASKVSLSYVEETTFGRAPVLDSAVIDVIWVPLYTSGDEEQVFNAATSKDAPLAVAEDSKEEAEGYTNVEPQRFNCRCTIPFPPHPDGRAEGADQRIEVRGSLRVDILTAEPPRP